MPKKPHGKKPKRVVTKPNKPTPPSSTPTIDPESGFENCTEEGLAFAIIGAPKPQKLTTPAQPSAQPKRSRIKWVNTPGRAVQFIGARRVAL